MYEFCVIGIIWVFLVEFGKYIKCIEYLDVRILCKLELYFINLRYSLRYLNIFFVVVFIIVLY